MIDNRQVGKRIAKMRQASGLTQQQLAGMMNVSHQAVSKWESGQALPDIQTLLELTRFFGMTVEQLILDESKPELVELESATDVEEKEEKEAQTEAQSAFEMEANCMTIQQLLQMAPYMSKETVEEIVMEMDARLTAGQIARVAPYVRPESVEKLIEKHRPELTWDSLRRIAPYMSREAVDQLARAIASGKETVKPAGENFNKAINDIGKAFDDIGKGVGQAVQKAIRFGGNVINEVSSAISDLSSDAQAAPANVERSEKAVALRKKAFERALKDGKWEWIGEHIREIDSDTQMKTNIAARAKEMGMHDWICKYMGGYADEFTIEAAIAHGSWGWLGDNAWQLEEKMQEKVALAAMRAENWQWLGKYSDQLNLKGCGMEIARTALSKGAKILAAQIAEHHLSTEEIDTLAREAYQVGDLETFNLLAANAGPQCLDEVFTDLGAKGKWEQLQVFLKFAQVETIEKLMELAVDQGNFVAVDMLDQYL